MFRKAIVVLIGIILTSAALAAAMFSLPFSNERSWVLTQGYNNNTHIKYNNHGVVDDRFALDFSLSGCEAYGKPVLAAGGGTVVVAKSEGKNGGYGTTVVVEHANGYFTRYAHMKHGDLEVSTGEKVFKGQIIGYVANTGFHFPSSSCPEHPGTHLHFVVYNGGRIIDQAPFYVDGKGIKPDLVTNHDTFIAGRYYSSDNTLITRSEALAMREQEKKDKEKAEATQEDNKPAEVIVEYDAWPFDVVWEGTKKFGSWVGDRGKGTWDAVTGLFGGEDEVADKNAPSASLSEAFNRSESRTVGHTFDHEGENESNSFFRLPQADTRDDFANSLTNPNADTAETDDVGIAQRNTDLDIPTDTQENNNEGEESENSERQEAEQNERPQNNDKESFGGEGKEESDNSSNNDTQDNGEQEKTPEKQEESKPINTGGDKRYGPNGPVVFPFARQQNRIPTGEKGDTENKEEAGDDTPNHLVINEVQIADSEFVEIYNPTASSVNLGGWHFAYYSSSRTQWHNPWRNKPFPTSTISGSGYYLIGLNNITTPQADWSPYSSSQLSNSKGTVAIFDKDPESSTSTKPVDAVGWGEVELKEGSAVPEAPSEGQSISRDSTHSDTNNNKADFTATDPTPQNSIETLAAAAPMWGSYQNNARNSAILSALLPTSTTTISGSFAVEGTPGANQPLVDGAGNIYLATHEAVYSFTPNLKLNWKHTSTLDGRYRPKAALSADSTKLYLAHSGSLATLNTKDGSTINTSAAGGIQDAHPVYDADSNTVFAVSRWNVCAFDEWGNEKWAKSISDISGGEISKTEKVFHPVVANNTLYITAGDNGGWGSNLFFALNIATGSTLWSADFEEGSGINHVGGYPAITEGGGTLIIGVERFKSKYGIAAYDLNNQAEFLWKKSDTKIFGSPRHQPPVPVDSSKAYATFAPFSQLYRFEQNEDSPLTTSVFSAVGEDYSTPLIADSSETIIFGTDAGNLYAVDGTSDTRTEYWSLNLGAKITGIAATRDSIVVVTDEAKIYILQ